MRRWLKRPKSSGRSARLALDVGTEYVKAIVVSTGDEPAILGTGRARQTLGDMEGGAVARIAGVTACCERAIEQACVVAGLRPIEVVMGIAGQFVQGATLERRFRRQRPGRPLSRRELQSMLAVAREEAIAHARDTLASQTGLEALDVELVDSSLVEVRIDGYRVKSPLDFQGTYVDVSLFHTFSPLVHIGALRTIAARLGLVLLATIAEPHAVALAALPAEAYDSGAVVLDVGGGSSDIAVVQKRGIAATKSFTLAGRSFTRSLAVHLRCGMEEAESLKLDFAAGLLEPPLAGEVERAVQSDLPIYRDALALALRDLAEADPLPPRLYLCGGGSALPGIFDLCAQTDWGDLFEGPPAVCSLAPEDVTRLADPSAHLAGQRDVTPKCLGVQAATAGGASLEGWRDSVDTMAEDTRHMK